MSRPTRCVVTQQWLGIVLTIVFIGVQYAGTRSNSHILSLQSNADTMNLRGRAKLPVIMPFPSNGFPPTEHNKLWILKLIRSNGDAW